MGGGSKKGGNKAPDFSKLAMVNQNGPMGNVTWGKDANGNMTMNTGFSGPAQGVWNNVMNGMNQGSQFNPATAGQDAFNKVYGAYQSRLDPMWAQRQQGFNAQMANSGAEPGSEAFSNASRDFNVGRNDAYSQAIGQSVGLGQAEQANARQNAMLPFGQAGAMYGLLPHGDPNAPFKAGVAQYEAAQDQQSADNAKKGQTMSGLGSIAGFALGGPMGGAAGGALGGALGGDGSPNLGNWASQLTLPTIPRLGG